MSSGYAGDLLAEARRPHGEGTLLSPRRTARAANPVCGDEIDLDLDTDGTVITAIAHRARGCVFTRASASILAREVAGATAARAREMDAIVRGGLSGAAELPAPLAALAQVRMYPARIRCALLPWDALRSALDSME